MGLTSPRPIWTMSLDILGGFYVTPYKIFFGPILLESPSILINLFVLICRYITKSQFEGIVEFFTEDKFLFASDCVEQSKEDPSLIKLFSSLGGQDDREEGIFRTFKNDTLMEYLPWTPGNPNIGGYNYNCLALILTFYVENDKIVSVEKAEVYDNVCYRAPGHCTLCSVDGPVREMRVRGLCRESIYDSKYFYNIGETGDILYLGEQESKISFSRAKNVWLWADRNFPDSLGSVHCPHTEPFVKK